MYGIFDVWHNIDDFHKSHDLRKLAQPERLGLTTLKTGVGDYLEQAYTV